MNQDKLTIRLANRSDEQKIADFRIEQYKTAAEFTIVDLEALSRQRGKILLAEFGGSIISTMQMEMVESITSFRALETAFIPLEFSDFPTIYLSKAGTTKPFRNMGLNTLLRKLVIENSLRTEAIASVTGTAYENAPRIHLLKRLGYDITEIPPDIHYARPVGKELFLCLKRSNFQSALDVLNVENEALQKSFHLKFEDLFHIHAFLNQHC